MHILGIGTSILGEQVPARGGGGGSAMVPLDRTCVTSYRLSIVTMLKIVSGTPIPIGTALVSFGHSLAHVKI